MGLFLLGLACQCLMWGSLRCESLDQHFFYLPEAVPALLDALGTEGRQTYWLLEWVDCFFLTIYSFLLMGLAQWITQKKMWRSLSGFELGLCLLPGFFDFFETSTILFLLHVYPNRHVDVQLSWSLAQFLSLITPLKWTSGLLVVIFFLNRSLKPRERFYFDV